MNTNPFHRRVAKFCFWLSGKTMFVKLPQKTYQLISEASDENPHDFRSEYIGRRWSTWWVSRRLLRASIHWDPHRWDHRALQHTDCNPVPCAMCNGCVCEPREFLDNH